MLNIITSLAEALKFQDTMLTSSKKQQRRLHGNILMPSMPFYVTPYRCYTYNNIMRV